jgi:cytochrome c553
MSRKYVVQLTGCLLLGAVICLPAMAADDGDKKPKFKTKEIMKKAFKGPLLKKVAGGDASDEEKKQLHEMLVSLSKNEPPKGEKESWEKLTGALVKAGEAAVKGDEKAGAMLKKAANCKACHKSHKP